MDIYFVENHILLKISRINIKQKKFDLQGEGHETTTCGQIIENQLTGENEKRGILWKKKKKPAHTVESLP